MRRLARSNFLARRQISSLLVQIRNSRCALAGWPINLNAAYSILSRELSVSDLEARLIVAEAVQAAHIFARAADRQAGDLVQLRVRATLCKNVERIAKCTKRSVVALRGRLDAAAITFVQKEKVDLEDIESIILVTAKIFREHRDEESSRTALRVMTYPSGTKDPKITIANDLSCLNARDRIRAVDALAALGKASKKITAYDVFSTLSSTLQNGKSKKSEPQLNELIVNYVGAVADLWKRYGLKPSRSGHAVDTAYRSKFHRFVDLVLTEMVEPWARRHDGSAAESARRLRSAQKSLPKEYRSVASLAQRRADIEWLVGRHHIDEALDRSKNRQ
jgi:hypothetical protein